MSGKHRRYFLKARESKELLDKASKRLRIDLEQVLKDKANVEVVQAESIELFLINGRPALARTEENIYPTLTFKEFLEHSAQSHCRHGSRPPRMQRSKRDGTGNQRVQRRIPKRRPRHNNRRETRQTHRTRRSPIRRGTSKKRQTRHRHQKHPLRRRQNLEQHETTHYRNLTTSNSTEDVPKLHQIS